jgi:DNA-binding CsgD family transcriptional regulator
MPGDRVPDHTQRLSISRAERSPMARCCKTARPTSRRMAADRQPGARATHCHRRQAQARRDHRPRRADAAEPRVARLAADGLSNREIAQALFITTRTAKVHLGRVYRKLDITRRSQLAGALTELRDDGREHQSASATAIS